jgi:hypothetical protein
MVVHNENTGAVRHGETSYLRAAGIVVKRRENKVAQPRGGGHRVLDLEAVLTERAVDVLVSS